MGAVKLDPRMDRKDPRYTVKRLFADAFGPSPTLFTRTSWCGWRPVIDPFTHLNENGVPALVNSEIAPAGTLFTPEFTMEETGTALTIVVPLPRVVTESLYLEIADDVLRVAGDEFDSPVAESTDEGDNRPRKPFNRVIVLPPDIQAGAIRARLHGNILEIVITKEI